MPRQTLLAFLDQPNPILKIRISRPSEVTEKEMEDWGWPKIPKITPWKLDMRYIKTRIGFLLKKEFDFPDHIMDLPDTEKVIFDERTFEFLLAKWNAAIMDTALSVVNEALGHVPEFPQLCLASGSSGKSNTKLGKPDWAVVPSKTPGKQHTCLAPGDTKATHKEYDHTLTVVNKMNGWARKYLAQIGHYAEKRDSRYFWCITPVELMVCRRTRSFTQGEITPQVAFFSWVPGPRQDVPVNLALFFVLFAAGLRNDVKTTWDDAWREHQVALRKIRAAVRAL